MTLRRTPEDFRVHERPDPAVLAGFLPAPATTHPVAVYEVTKHSLTTPEALPRLARALNLPKADRAALAYAGLKDKHAVTTQLVSVRPRDAAARSWPAEAAAPGLSARLVGFAREDAQAAWILRNEFTLVVRDLSPAAVREMGRRAALMDLRTPDTRPPLRTLLVVNAFGEQRFGSARHGEGFAGRELVKGRFEQALQLLIGTPARKDSGARREFTRLLANGWGDWKRVLKAFPRCPHRAPIEALAGGKGFKDAFAALPHLDQQMAVEAYQSFLWNAAAAELLHGLPGAETTETDYGPLIIPPAQAVPEAWRTLQIPTPAAGMRPVEPWAPAMAKVLSREGLHPDALRIPGLRRPSFDAVPRDLFVRAEHFSLSGAEPDELSRPGRVRTTASFSLPRGAYATVVMRALGQ